MPIIEMSLQIALECDECGERPGKEDFSGYFLYDAADPEQALHDADYHRDGERIICPTCFDEAAAGSTERKA